MSQNFSKGKIYKITNDYNNGVYIGSTCDTLARRFTGHKSKYQLEKNKNRNLYQLMNEIGFNRFRIELIEEYPCDDKYQLRQREGYFIREMGTLNQVIAGRKSKEYYQDNKEDFKERSKIQEQKETQKETRKSYREEVCKKLMICECGCEITRHSLSRHLKTKKHLELIAINNVI